MNIKRWGRSTMLVTLIATQLILSCSDDDTPAVDPNMEKREELTNSFVTSTSRFLENNPSLPGVLVHVYKPDIDLEWYHADGARNADGTGDLNPKEPFIIASLTKSYVATAVMTWVEQGLVSLDSPLGDLLPEDITEALSVIDGQSLGAEITIRQLLNHSSGLYDYLEGGQFHFEGLNTPQQRYTPEDRIRYVVENGSSYFAPGMGQEYTNTGYHLIDLIAQLNESIPDLATSLNQINMAVDPSGPFAFKPTASFSQSGIIDGFFNEQNVSEYTYNLDWGSADGGIINNTEGIRKFYWSLFTEDLITTSSLNDMLSFNGEYGLGVELLFESAEYGRVYGHTGATPGYTSIAAYLERYDAIVVICGNQTEDVLENGSDLINDMLATIALSN